MSNTNKGSAMLATVLQKRMSQVVAGKSTVSLETGEIMAGRKLKLSSLPGSVLDKDDYSLCANLQAKMPCQKSYPINVGDQVLVAWTYDGEPVVIDKILRADQPGAVKACSWQNVCSECKELQKEVSELNQQGSNLESKVEELE